MELKELILRGIELLKSEPIIAIIIMGIIAVLFYFKTKTMLKLLAILSAFALLFYILNLFYGLTSTGVFQKEKIIQKSLQ
ncbi:MAG: hypothetical protein AVO38_02060 [delta proteobacterium ML8_D]|jgi:hypothetical protein|nr:MAG: hypothetical protein AVO38_02060 [delta proteobacterium ML8_D]